MQIVLCIVSVLFGGLSMIAAFSQLKGEQKPASAFLMIGGSLLLVAAVILNILGKPLDWAIALLGCIGICVAAIWNGKKSGQLHIQHHIIRAALSLVLIIGFAVL